MKASTGRTASVTICSGGGAFAFFAFAFFLPPPPPPPPREDASPPWYGAVAARLRADRRQRLDGLRVAIHDERTGAIGGAMLAAWAVQASLRRCCSCSFAMRSCVLFWRHHFTCSRRIS